jgi:hypothetical protein
LIHPLVRSTTQRRGWTRNPVKCRPRELCQRNRTKSLSFLLRRERQLAALRHLSCDCRQSRLRDSRYQSHMPIGLPRDQANPARSWRHVLLGEAQELTRNAQPRCIEIAQSYDSVQEISEGRLGRLRRPVVILCVRHSSNLMGPLSPSADLDCDCAEGMNITVICLR